MQSRESYAFNLGMSDVLTLIKERSGGCVALAAKLSAATPAAPITSQAVSQWRRVPAERVLSVEAITGVSRHQIRPDIFGAPPEAGEAA